METRSVVTLWEPATGPAPTSHNGRRSIRYHMHRTTSLGGSSNNAEQRFQKTVLSHIPLRCRTCNSRQSVICTIIIPPKHGLDRCHQNMEIRGVVKSSEAATVPPTTRHNRQSCLRERSHRTTSLRESRNNAEKHFQETVLSLILLRCRPCHSVRSVFSKIIMASKPGFAPCHQHADISGAIASLERATGPAPTCHNSQRRLREQSHRKTSLGGSGNSAEQHFQERVLSLIPLRCRPHHCRLPVHRKIIIAPKLGFAPCRQHTEIRNVVTSSEPVTLPAPTRCN